MPTYDYKCASCCHEEEVSHKIIEEPLIKCPRCFKSEMTKKISGGLALHFKGTGFYKTDYK
jgi:putative FmdB family regulatory protein